MQKCTELWGSSPLPHLSQLLLRGGWDGIKGLLQLKEESVIAMGIRDVVVWSMAAPIGQTDYHYRILDQACVLLNENDACDLQVSVGEAIANAVEHSGGTQIFMEIGVAFDYIRVSISVPDGKVWEFDSTANRTNAMERLAELTNHERETGRGYLMMLLSTYSIRICGKQLQLLIERTDERT